MYKVANASQYLAITGSGIADIKIAKESWVSPWQSCTILDISPVNYTFNVQAMSAEKFPFILPAIFTIGPKADEPECLLKYARLFSAHDQHSNHVYARLFSTHDQYSNHVKDLIQGIIEGETRDLAASMTIEQIFKGTKEFKKQVFDHVQLQLNQFGLLIYNANVKQLVDVASHEYFSYLGQKTQMEAANQARVDVAEVRMGGEIGSKTGKGETLQNAAKIDAEKKVIAAKIDEEKKVIAAKIDAERKVIAAKVDAEIKIDAKKKVIAAKIDAGEKVIAAKMVKLEVQKEEIKVKSEGQKEKEKLEVQKEEIKVKSEGQKEKEEIKVKSEGEKEEIKVKSEGEIFENAEVAEANSELATKRASWIKSIQVSEVAPREAELEKQTRTEKLKAEFLSKASVDYETKVSLLFIHR